MAASIDLTNSTSLANPTNLAKLAVNPACRDDPFHRYLMPALQITHLAKNGGQTYLNNAVAVAKALARPLPVLNKFFGGHLSTRSQVKVDQIALVGSYSSHQVSAALDVFILDQILCRSCANPETVVDKDRIKCKACGYARVLHLIRSS